MASERDVFGLSGPGHLTHIDWKNPDHRRSVAASLVQGVYVMERDRQQNRQGPEALAPAWWEFFHFHIIRKLVDDADFSIFGAIYEFKFPTANQSHSATPEAPKYVIAFRGTITKPDSFSRDLKLDLHFIQNGLHRTSRFELAMQAVRNIVSTVGHLNVWLCGHSLGSAMAMLAGKNMAKTGIFLESFLFNPPFVSAPIERIKDKKLKQGIRIAGSVITAGLAFAVKSRQGRSISEDPFAMLSAWVPCLFVNPVDHICSEYIGYFKHRKKMEKIGAGGIERLATQNSIGDLFLTALGKESDPLHLLPSANLTINQSPSPDFKTAHGIHQWWWPDVQLKYKMYLYK
ncbi:GDSL esterase/lipase At4g10955-like [Magnolia sinica]|uniref:GDSL esterase/lipase At4g10955-like n=1 Tax=Magnolia sinica TaxID=86752 RepID=UPI0026592EB9|nr:GDSL esterase/lipase At4g10955-like [Magnolia sinica]XP_058100435.1 GDSL esterase/lipase At4g10955-like [Magnolia sinica]XP_058100436.1 GDSL esterase/lipase At4g10955-like [Magnolia sinica]